MLSPEKKYRGMPHFVEESLDQVLATSIWMDNFSNAEVLNLEVVTSDHSTIFLNLSSIALSRSKCFDLKLRYLNPIA